MKLLPAIPLLAALAASVPATAHAAYIEFSVSGVVADGIDENNLFTGYDEPADAIVGRPYTMTFTVDTAQFVHSMSDTAHVARSDPDKPIDLYGKLTIGARSYAWRLDWDASASAMLGPGTSAAMENSGRFGWTDQGWASIAVEGHGAEAPVLDGLGFEQRIVYAGMLDPGGYSAEFDFIHTTPRAPDDNGAETYRTHLVGTGARALWQVSAVPEPAHYGMLLGGLAVLVGAARRSRKQ